MDFNSTVNNLVLCKDAVAKASEIYWNESVTFKSMDCKDEVKSENNGVRFTKLFVFCSSALKSLYSVLFFDSNEKKMVLALVHDTKGFNEDKLVNLSGSAKKPESPNEFPLNSEFLEDGKDHIFFCQHYVCDLFKQKKLQEEFANDCNKVFKLLETIVMHKKA